MNLSGIKALPTGNIIDLNNVSDYEFTVEEIAELLSHVKRFNGYGMDVASHSIWVARTLYYLTGNPHIALLGLLHDAQEGYIGDIATPVKHVAGNDWDELENKLQRAIQWQLFIQHENNLGAKGLVKLIDLVSLKLEYEQMVEAGTFKSDSKGVWEAALANVNTIEGIEPPKEDPRSAVDFVFAYNHYKALCEEQVSYTKCKYLFNGESYICSINDEHLSTFYSKL